MKKRRYISIILLLTVQFFAVGQNRRTMWLWASSGVVGNSTNENILINECLDESITDLYVYVPGVLTVGNYSAVRSFISKAGCNNIRVWGMDGWRGYFSDLCGPSEFYGYIQDVINYNNVSASDEKFFGFHGDNEFHVSTSSSGCGPADGFHYGIRDVNLNTTSGGVWYASEKADRDSLMADFVQQTKTASEMCHAEGMEYSIAIMPWVSGVNYTHGAIGGQSTPLYATFGGVNKELYKHLMDYLDEYIVMSYHTNVPGKVVNMLEDELSYADGLPSATRPRVMSSLETHCGVAQYVSYCDTPGEDSKNHVNSEMDLHVSLMGAHDSYTGLAIHDWVGWRDLPSVSNNSSEPAGGSCTVNSLQSNLSMNISLYPNPVNDRLKVEFDEVINGSITIVTLDGVEIINENINQAELVFDLSEISSGVYFVVVNSGQDVLVKKFVVE